MTEIRAPYYTTDWEIRPQLRLPAHGLHSPDRRRRRTAALLLRRRRRFLESGFERHGEELWLLGRNLLDARRIDDRIRPVEDLHAGEAVLIVVVVVVVLVLQVVVVVILLLLVIGLASQPSFVAAAVIHLVDRLLVVAVGAVAGRVPAFGALLAVVAVAVAVVAARFVAVAAMVAGHFV